MGLEIVDEKKELNLPTWWKPVTIEQERFYLIKKRNAEAFYKRLEEKVRKREMVKKWQKRIKIGSI